MPRDQQVMSGLAALEPRKTQQAGIPTKERRKRTEQIGQTDLFRFLSLFYIRYPHLEWIHSSGNGMFAGYDENAKRRAADAVCAGLKRGVWDIFVPCPRMVQGVTFAAGMYVEMKTELNKLTADQERFGVAMKRAGYVCVVCYSWYEAAGAILSYLGDCPSATIALAAATPAHAKPDYRPMLKGAAKRSALRASASASVPLSERTAVQRSHKRKTVADKETK